jgi:hypothetical protein
LEPGAFQTLAQNGFGKLILWLVIIGFVGYGLWQATEAGWGHRGEPDDRKRAASRVESAVKAVIYLVLAVIAFSGTLPIEQTNEITATSGPTSGPHSFASSGWSTRKKPCQNASGTQAPSAPASSSPRTMSTQTEAQSMTK